MNKEDLLLSLHPPYLREKIMAGKQLQLKAILLLRGHKTTMLTQVSSLLGKRQELESGKLHRQDGNTSNLSATRTGSRPPLKAYNGPAGYLLRKGYFR